MNRKTGKLQDDNELIRDFQAGSEAAFNTLVSRHADAVFTLCFRIIGDYDEAGDCAQEVFIKVYRGLGGFRFQSGFPTWLHAVAVNTCRNYLSSLARRVSLRMIRLDAPSDPDRVSREPGDRTYDPEAQYIRKERDEGIQAALNQLPDSQRILVVLRDIEGKSYEEISIITGLKLGTVKSKLLRARQGLRELLKGIL
jgi:RNA polymerase sigma-70 factor (ECF subfamily)